MLLPNQKEEASFDKKEYKVKSFNLDKSYLDKYRGKKFYLKTYGCQMNERDSETLAAMLVELGYDRTENYREADLLLLNTCSVRENAHNKAFGMLGRFKHLKEEKPDIIVGICGCMAQEETVCDEIIKNYKFVNLVFGTHNIDKLPELLDKAITNNSREIEVLSREADLVEKMPVVRSSKYKAYVNIIYGCDKFCTYCIVPYTRGREQSRKREDILEEVNSLVKDGYKEVTILGQNVNAYGKDLYDDYHMGELLEDIAKTGIPRIRFMTSHPWDFTDKMIDVMAKYPNIMPSIHLPVQSGSNRILKLMGRRYTRESYLELFHKIKDKIPGVTISTDIIVGFPGETEEDFLETMSLVDECKFDNAFTFIYSERIGTPACKLKNSVDINIREERLQRLNDKVNGYFLEHNKELIGKKLPVLVEGISDKKNIYFGYSDTNKLVNFTSEKGINAGDIVDVLIKEAHTWSIDGEVR
ncbi:MAG: tRNA (N6-isopentenyl adenosine(37)-C2)-methylthiotransferase MiaB [Bacilli bacterium]|nr:tRNA (N6-isopentenyl adenosine(37)-C2)-methylthiotransferase MiaB [Bacilli bacterium]